MAIDDEERARIIATSLENERRLIAAGKLERWEVVKWLVTVNVTLSAASVAIKQADCTIDRTFLALAAITAFIGCLLLAHINRRMTGARRAAWHLEHFVGFQVSRITSQHSEKPPSSRYDWKVLSGLWFLIFVSLLPLVLLAWHFGCFPDGGKPFYTPCWATAATSAT